MMPSTRSIPFLLLLLLSTACAGTETGNPSIQESSLTLHARSRDASVVTIGTGSGRIRVDAAWMALGAVGLSPCDGEPREVLSPVTQDVVAAPEPRVFEHERDAYCALSSQHVLAPTALPPGAPPELADRSLVIIGRRTDDVAFRLGSAAVVPFTLSAPPPGFAVDDQDHSLILAFDLAAWFADVDLDTIAVLPGDSIRINAAENPDQLAAFEAAIAGSASLHHDLDGDAVLDPEDQTEIAQ
jgi:hypothetical protein